MAGVVKVIRTPEIFKSGQRALGIAHFEGREVVVVDLHQKIYGSTNVQYEKYVVITEVADQLYGILVTQLPTLVTIPWTELKPLPAEYRQRDPLGIASHVASIAQGTVFLVDLAEGLKVA